MTTISSSTLSSLVDKTSTSSKSASATYSQFLTLLTTQMQNQDPLDPMESSEFTNQLVQFSQVEQGILTNEKLDSVLAQMNSNQMSSSFGYIGKDIYYQGDTVYYEGKDLKLGYAIDGEAASAKLHIYDADNNLVRTLDLPTGTTSGSINWDGKDDQGVAVDSGKTYTLKLSALDADNAAVDGYTGVPATVEGVETISGVLYLALNGDRRVQAGSVLSISEPDSNTELTGTSA